jgi:hypothetical protein
MKVSARVARPSGLDRLTGVFELPFAVDKFHPILGIVGGAFVLWAALIAGLGMTRERFPGGAGGQRAVILVTLVLTVAVVGVAVQTA